MSSSALIAERRNALAAVFSTFDPNVFRGLVADDVIWAPPHGPAKIGAAILIEWISPFFDQYKYEICFETQTLDIAERQAIEKGRMRTILTPSSGGESIVNESAFIIVWRAVSGGDWRVAFFCDASALTQGDR